MAYQYITENNLYHKQTYSYSEYGGTGFLKEYVASRKEYLNRKNLHGTGSKESGVQECPAEAEVLGGTVQDLRDLRGRLKEGYADADTMERLNAYTKSFEVRKRIYGRYNREWKPVGTMEFENYGTYLLFAECLVFACQNTESLKYFSCLLKLDDTLLSVWEKMDAVQRDGLYRILEKELGIFRRIADGKGICLEETYGTK